MKRCTSCSKDLPDAALHCVFCGAKQALTPAVQPGLAKTAFGYSANEMMDQLRAQAPAAAPYSQPRHPPSQPPPGYPGAPGAAPMGAPVGAPMAPMPNDGSQPNYPPGYAGPPGGAPMGAPMAPMPNDGSQPNYPPGYGQPGPQGGGMAPAAAANAPTMFLQPGGAPVPQGYPAGAMSPAPAAAMPPAAMPGPAPAPLVGGFGPPAAPAAPAGPAGGMGIHSPSQPTPAPLPAAAPPPYLASQTAARAGRPIDPWRGSLRLMMFWWGLVMLAAFATPVSSDPLAFHWDAILHGEGTAKLPALIMAATGVLSVLLAAIPMPTFPRGLLAGLLGLAGIFVPIGLAGMPQWQVLLGLIGTLTLIPGLLVRNEYCDSLFARILVTVGVICTLIPLIIPVGGEIPLVAIFKGLLDAPGAAKLRFVLEIGLIVIVVMSLLAWMPGPATGGAKVFAWLILLWATVIDHVVTLLVAGNVGDAVKASPFGATLAWAPEAVYLVLVGYGLAAVFGKQLE